MNREFERPTRYVLVVDRGAGTRSTGVIAAGVYGEPDGEDTVSVVFDMAEVDATLTGKQVGRNIADFICEQMEPDIPVTVMIGTTVGGTRPVKSVVIPAARRRLKDIRKWAEGEGEDAIARRAADGFAHDLYCANVAGAPRDVGRKITVHQRVGELTTALELGRLRILGDLALYEDVTNVLRSFDPGKRSKEGKDLWDSGSREGIITALTVVSMAHGHARMYRPDGSREQPRLISVTSADTGYGTAPANYVGASGVFGIDGTVLGGGGVFRARPGQFSGSSPYADSYLRPRRLEQALSAWRGGEGEPVERWSSGLSRSTQRARGMTGGPSLASPPVYDDPQGGAP